MRNASNSSLRTRSRFGVSAKYAVTPRSVVSVPSAPASINAYSTASCAAPSMSTSSAYHPAGFSFALVNCRLIATEAILIQQLFLVAPVFLDFHKQLEMHAVAQQLLDVFARANADIFQAAGAFSDDDLFLRPSLDNDEAVDAREVFTNFFVTLGDNCGDVWNLVARR